jgi:glycosyltransferase involved in cell wall biosynthesis
LIGQNHLSEKIKIKGFLPHKELLHKLRNHKFNVIILPSLSEGLPAALIEGAAHSILVIGSDRGGTAELIGKKNVFLIKDPTDPKQILKALQSINKLNAKQAIERNYQTIKDNFDAKKCTQRLIDEITAD